MRSIIVAMTPDRVIGNKGALPWKMPSDLRRFWEITKGHPVAMDIETFYSIIAKNGKPLGDGRINFVFTHHNNKKVAADGGLPVVSLEQIADHKDVSDEIFIIGGANIYKQFLPIAHRLYITIVCAHIKGDTYFPEINLDRWKLERYTHLEQNPKDEYRSLFAVYYRK